MSLGHSLQKGCSDFSLILGKALTYGGGAGLFVMAVVGTISVDLVLLKVAEKNRDGFLTGYIWGSMMNRPYVDPVPLLVASPIISGIAIALSFALGVPEVGVALLAGWILAATVMVVGLALVEFAKAIDPEPTSSSYGMAY